MDRLRVAEELVKMARELVTASVMVYRDSANDYFPSLRSMVKSNNGVWKSDKQGAFILKALASGRNLDSEKGTVYEKLANSVKPSVPDLKAAVVHVGVAGMGRRRTVYGYGYWIDPYGVALEFKIKFKDGKPDRAETTFTRDKSVTESEAKRMTEVKRQDQAWFTKNKSAVSLVIKQLDGHDFWGKFVNQLKEGFKISDNAWTKMLDEAKRLKGVAKADDFPEGEKVKMVLPVKVMFIKYNWTIVANPRIALIGQPKGYKQRAYILLNHDIVESLVKMKPGESLDYSPAEKLDKKLVGKTVKINSTFERPVGKDIIFRAKGFKAVVTF